jgi:hypothetical protein
MDEPIDAVLLLARTEPVPHPHVAQRHERQLAGAMAGSRANPSSAGAGRNRSSAPPGAARSLRRSRLVVLSAALAVGLALVLPLRARVDSSQTEVATASPDRGTVPTTSPAYSGVDANDLASTHAKPSYLPVGAVYEGGHPVKYANGWVDSWSLAGEVNSRVMPPTPSEGTPGAWYHPATDIALTQLAQTTSTFHAADTRLVKIETIDLNGVPATVVTPVNGYGVYRIAWVRAGVAYDLQTQRLKVDAAGTMSGVPIGELLLMARSVG